MVSTRRSRLTICRSLTFVSPLGERLSCRYLHFSENALPKTSLEPRLTKIVNIALSYSFVLEINHTHLCLDIKKDYDLLGILNS